MAHSIARATLGLTKPAQIDPLKVPSFFLSLPLVLLRDSFFFFKKLLRDS